MSSLGSSSGPDIGSQIRKARQALGLSQVQLAERLGNTERTVQTWEGNERTPRLANLLSLGRELRQEVAFFYGSEDPETIVRRVA